jgi:uncharacterized membrane protein YdjX (TVP38/TMEM64 family)
VPLLAFLAARHLLADGVRARFGQRLAEVDKGIEADGAFYLFTLRLIPRFRRPSSTWCWD